MILQTGRLLALPRRDSGAFASADQKRHRRKLKDRENERVSYELMTTSVTDLNGFIKMSFPFSSVPS
jgi:hypothetical protein